ncbi:hypothetical protein ILYODFUR_036463 [Ilyodon furcidens]|uniref:Uncharacterized protein n=1 Tax=Ilyodon furcidens TaxID=33524 RepID=A0ABV0SSW9_9TELE
MYICKCGENCGRRAIHSTKEQQRAGRPFSRRQQQSQAARHKALPQVSHMSSTEVSHLQSTGAAAPRSKRHGARRRAPSSLRPATQPTHCITFKFLLFFQFLKHCLFAMLNNSRIIWYLFVSKSKFVMSPRRQSEGQISMLIGLQILLARRNRQTYSACR